MKSYLSWLKTWKCLPIIDFAQAWDLAYKKQYRQAAEKFEHGLKNYPDHIAAIDARYALAQTYKQLNDIQAFKRTLKSAIRFHPSHPLAYQHLAAYEAKCGAYREAVRILKSSLPYVSNCEDLKNDICFYLLQARAPKEYFLSNLSDLELTIVTLSSLPRMLYELRFGNIYRARKLLDLRFQAENETEDERLLYACFCLEQGKVLFARQLLRELYEQNPKSPEINFKLAQSYIEDKKFEDNTAGLHYALEACRLSNYQHVFALDLASKLYQEQEATMLSQLFKSRCEQAKINGCFENLNGEHTAHSNSQELIIQ